MRPRNAGAAALLLGLEVPLFFLLQHSLLLKTLLLLGVALAILWALFKKDDLPLASALLFGSALASLYVLPSPIPKALKPLSATLGFGVLAWAEERRGGALPLAFLLFGIYALRFLSSALTNPCCSIDFDGIYLGAAKIAAGLRQTLFSYTFVDGKILETVPEALRSLFPSPVYHHTGHPGLLALALPITLASPKAAAVGFKVLSIALFGTLSVLLSLRASRPWARVMALWLFLSPNLKHTVLVEANISSLAASLVGLSLFLGIPALQGLLAALASILKLALGLPVALMPFLKPRSRWLWAWGTLGFVSLLGLGVIGFKAHWTWFEAMHLKLAAQWLYPENYQVSWFANALGLNRTLSLLVSYALNLPLALLLIWRGLKLRRWPESGALWIAATPHLQTYLWHHHLLPVLVAGWVFARRKAWLLAPAFFLWWAYLYEPPHWKLLPLLGLFALSFGLLTASKE